MKDRREYIMLDVITSCHLEGKTISEVVMVNSRGFFHFRHEKGVEDETWRKALLKGPGNRTTSGNYTCAQAGLDIPSC